MVLITIPQGIAFHTIIKRAWAMAALVQALETKKESNFAVTVAKKFKIANVNNKTKMKLIKDYETALQAIYDHVGFVEDWVTYPLDDCTDKYWYVNEEDKEVHYADTKRSLEDQDGNYYVDELYTQRFYKKWVYVGEELTMIFCNPGIDGMKWFRLFDNTKRCSP